MSRHTADGAPGLAQLQADVQARVLSGLPEHLERLSWPVERIRAAQAEGLQHLLAHATQRSPFHRRRLRGVDVGTVDPEDLSHLPVMTKAQMMDAFDEVLTDPRLDRATVEQALAATTTEPVPLHGEFVAMASGGSSGRRGVFVYDRPALAGFMLSLARPLFARLATAGGPPPGGLEVAMVAAASAVHATRAMTVLVTGPDRPLRFTSVPATLPLADIVDRLNTLNPPVLYSYPTVLALLAHQKATGRLQIAPQVVSSNSESLLPEARIAITAAFGVPVTDTFGTTEGLVGASALGDPVLVFNTDLCIVELVDHDNHPVPAGTPADKVLVTNLYNHVQPLVRYELNDVMVRQPDGPEHGHLRALVVGRDEPLLRYGTTEVHPHALRSVLVKEPTIIDHQIRQTPHGVDVDVLALPPLDTVALTARLRTALRTAGLTEPVVHIHVVDTLPINAGTGKLRRVVPLSTSPEETRWLS